MSEKTTNRDEDILISDEEIIEKYNTVFPDLSKEQIMEMTIGEDKAFHLCGILRLDDVRYAACAGC